MIESALHDRMLLIAERGWIDRGEPAHDGERRDLRFGREPALDRRQIRIIRPAMCGAHLDGLGRRAERSRKPIDRPGVLGPRTWPRYDITFGFQPI